MKRAEKKQHLLDVATELFNQFGYRAVGIDQVIAESGIAKTTLYRHYPSKEDLIVAVLKGIDEQFREAMRSHVERKGVASGDTLLATFDYLRKWFEDSEFFGCPFINAAGEYGDRNSSVFHAAMLHKRLMVAYFEELARASGFANPKEIAEEINLLHEGAIAIAHITGESSIAESAKEAARKLLKAS